MGSVAAQTGIPKLPELRHHRALSSSPASRPGHKHESLAGMWSRLTSPLEGQCQQGESDRELSKTC
jgi:hypothetical protein